VPSGTIKIGQSEYDVRTNGSPRTVEALANIPIKQVNGTTIYLRDVPPSVTVFRCRPTWCAWMAGAACSSRS
jgi:multidrug efflux pump subunit AcrB